MPDKDKVKVGVVTSQPTKVTASHQGPATVTDLFRKYKSADAITTQPDKNTNYYNAPVYVNYGLQPLVPLQQLFIKQKLEIIEALTCCETRNQYDVFNPMGVKIFKAEEENCCCTRQLCGSLRPFTMELSDISGNKVLFADRPLRCKTCFCPCCLQTLTVESPKGQRIGGVRQLCSPIWPKFQVEDADGSPVFLITGPCLQCKICGDVEFKITSLDGSANVGIISKQWSGILKEVFTDTDNFGVSFPVNLHEQLKATLLAAVFLIDFMYYEENEPHSAEHLLDIAQ